MANRFRKAVPSLPVKDCAEAIGYYCSVLGFEKDFDEPWGERHMAIADLYGHEIHFSSRRDR